MSIPRYSFSRALIDHWTLLVNIFTFSRKTVSPFLSMQSAFFGCTSFRTWRTCNFCSVNKKSPRQPSCSLAFKKCYVLEPSLIFTHSFTSDHPVVSSGIEKNGVFMVSNGVPRCPSDYMAYEKVHVSCRDCRCPGEKQSSSKKQSTTDSLIRSKFFNV